MGSAFIKAIVLLLRRLPATIPSYAFLFRVGIHFSHCRLWRFALLDARDGERTSAGRILGRTVAIVFVVSVVIGIVLLPFWLSLLHHPIDQTAIPHASRSNFILSPQWGLNYFILPYGALILAIPFIFIRGSSVVRLRPLRDWLSG